MLSPGKCPAAGRGMWSNAYLAAVAVASVACSGQSGAGGGAPEARSSALVVAAQITNDDEDASLRSRVEKGLEITPVPIDTSGMSRHQRKMVGLGSYIVNAASNCAGCHSAAGFLAGGNKFLLGDSTHFVWSRNLTPDPDTGLQLSLEEFKSALRTGQDFHAGATGMLLVMPWLYFRWMSDVDLDAVYAYLRAIPAVKNSVPQDSKPAVPPSIPFPGNIYTDGDVVRRLPERDRSFDSRRGLAISPQAQPVHLDGEDLRVFGIGSYIANATNGCNECHTNPERRPPPSLRINTPNWLTGGTVFSVPPPLQSTLHQVRSMSANLEGATHGFFAEPGDSFERFQALIHTRSHLDDPGTPPLGFPMILIAGYLDNLLEEDLRAVYAYVKSMPATTGQSDQPRQPYARWCGGNSDCRSGETCSPGHECVGGHCSSDVDCGACQTCGASNVCLPPASGSACVAAAR